MSLTEVMPWIIPLVALVIIIAAFRPALAKATSDTQERLIRAQREENANLLIKIGQLQLMIDSLEKEDARQKHVQETMRNALKPIGIDISVEGDFVRVVTTTLPKSVTTTLPIKKNPRKNPRAQASNQGKQETESVDTQIDNPDNTLEEEAEHE